MFITSYSISGSGEARLDLRLAFAPDGAAQVAGAVPFPLDDETVFLVAAPDTARCACADANGNGQSGITRIEFLARDPRSGELVPVTLMPSGAEDIDRAGRYELETHIGGQPGMVTVLVLWRLGRRKRRRRRRTRRR